MSIVYFITLFYKIFCIIIMDNLKYENYKGQIISVLTYLDHIITLDWTGRDKEFKDATSIDCLANIAHMSKRNLQIMFQSYVNETLCSYKNRLRLEYAQSLLKEGNMNITEISDMIGYANTPAFNNEFKKLYHMSPTQKKVYLQNKIKSYSPNKLPYRIEYLKETKVIYLSFTGDYKLTSFSQFEEKSWDKLELFAYKNNIINNNEYWGIAFDDTDITEEDKCRFYAALSVDNDKIVKTPVTEEIKSMNLPYGKYAVFTHKGDYNKLDKFYDSILCSIDFKLGNTPILEKYLNSPKNTSKKDLITEIWLPLLHAHISQDKT